MVMCRSGWLRIFGCLAHAVVGNRCAGRIPCPRWSLLVGQGWLASGAGRGWQDHSSFVLIFPLMFRALFWSELWEVCPDDSPTFPHSQ